jgi:hypothetical protein
MAPCFRLSSATIGRVNDCELAATRWFLREVCLPNSPQTRPAVRRHLRVAFLAEGKCHPRDLASDNQGFRGKGNTKVAEENHYVTPTKPLRITAKM